MFRKSLRFKLILSYVFAALIPFVFFVLYLLKDQKEISFGTVKSLLIFHAGLFWWLFFAVVLAFALGSLMAWWIAGPIDKVVRVSRKFAEGDISGRIIHDTDDEIGDLAADLNKMAESVEKKISTVEMQNQRLEAIFNSMIEGVIKVDRTGRISSVNPAVERMFGILDKDVKGKFFLEAVRNNDISDIISGVLEHGRSMSGEVNLVWPIRGVFRINAVPVFDSGAAAEGCLVVIHDITEIRKLETIRRDFVANVSHELKTPLTSIKGFVETLLEGALDDKKNNRDFLKIIQDHAERLDKLVDDLLSLSRIESKGITLGTCELDLARIFEDVIPAFMSQLKKKNITVRNGLTGKLVVIGDKDKIGQVFINLIDNAIKFNRENGYIKVYEQRTGGEIKIIVEDSGTGIPEKDRPRIFERFYRVDKARSRELGGTGLGLSIVKHIIELHGGKVGVESVEGLGSKFWFTLPAHK